jgi:hypothetical protein
MYAGSTCGSSDLFADRPVAVGTTERARKNDVRSIRFRGLTADGRWLIADR